MRLGYCVVVTLLSALCTAIGCVERTGTQTADQPSAAASTGGDLPSELVTPGNIPMVLIPGGEFTMGSDAERNASPSHQVTVSAFYMDRYEVTQEVYERISGRNPRDEPARRTPSSGSDGRKRLKFCNARSAADGLVPCYDLSTWVCNFAANGYRLPTEAEWEYACRAGRADDFGFDGGVEQLAAHAWFRDNSRRKHHPVGQKSPNAFGLYDMAGNVREWCNDWYAVDYYAQSPAPIRRGQLRVTRSCCAAVRSPARPIAVQAGSATATNRGLRTPVSRRTTTAFAASDGRSSQARRIQSVIRKYSTPLASSTNIVGRCEDSPSAGS